MSVNTQHKCIFFPKWLAFLPPEKILPYLPIFFKSTSIKTFQVDFSFYVNVNPFQYQKSHFYFSLQLEVAKSKSSSVQSRPNEYR